MATTSSPAPTFSTQRGVPYNPTAASKQRTEKMIAAARLSGPKKKSGRIDGTNGEIALYLDQVESAWKELNQSRRRSRSRGRGKRR